MSKREWGHSPESMTLIQHSFSPETKHKNYVLTVGLFNSVFNSNI